MPQVIKDFGGAERVELEPGAGVRARGRGSQDRWRNMRGIGGAERDRTAGLLVANEALSQLSYSPTPGTNLSYQQFVSFDIASFLLTVVAGARAPCPSGFAKAATFADGSISDQRAPHRICGEAIPQNRLI